MSEKRVPTFRHNNTLLTGPAAKKTWADQSVRCACGSSGDPANSISGTCKNMPAEWLGCSNCTGQAVGRPLVYRLPSQFE